MPSASFSVEEDDILASSLKYAAVGRSQSKISPLGMKAFLLKGRFRGGFRIRRLSDEELLFSFKEEADYIRFMQKRICNSQLQQSRKMWVRKKTQTTDVSSQNPFSLLDQPMDQPTVQILPSNYQLYNSHTSTHGQLTSMDPLLGQLLGDVQVPANNNNKTNDIFPSFSEAKEDEVFWVSADPPEWLDKLAKYIEDGVAPEDSREARLLRMRAPTYKVQDGVLYKRSYNGVLLRCLRAAEAKALMEEIHEGNMPGRPATNYTPISSVIPFSRWGIDIVGAFPKGVGQARGIVVAIDYFTKWVEAEPLAGITRRQMIGFVGTNILCRFGVPKQIISDNGTQFEEAEFQDFLKTWGIQHTKVSVAYLQANGQVENVNRTIINGIKKKLLSEGSKWVDELPRILWTYRTTPRRATGDTPFGLAYGFEARAPAEAVIPIRREIEYDPEVNEQNQAVELNFVEERRDEARIRAENYRRQVKSYFDSRVKPRAFQVGDYVPRKREKSQPTKGGKLAKKYEGPYIIKAVVRPGTYKLVTPKGKEIDRTWNVEHLVKFY
ncbi:unnamed protein product [Cuscuta campestris]|uniref:Integrase catalytic domain-containing protein n=1 Tax=Cuscuta campestris TaxID=132261 RepID=A0A484MMM9_9ASTE|nr:unnamed protein product [Cuscuta campestris]